MGEHGERPATLGDQEERIRVLEARLAASEANRRVTRRPGSSVLVPEAFAPIFEKSERTVSEYFERIDIDPAQGIIEINGERYLLIPATALSNDFLASMAKPEPMLEASEWRFRLAAQITRDLIYEWECGHEDDGSDDRLRWFGDIAHHLGHPPGELGEGIDSWRALLHPEDRTRLADIIDRHRRCTEPISEEYRLRHRDGSWRTVLDRGVPILDDAGRPTRWIGVCTDVTEQRRLESERAQAAKLESLGVLAGGIAHDFNNMLNSVLGNLELALQMIGDPELEEILGDCHSACLRTTDLTQQLLTFAKGGRPIRKTVDITTLVREATELSLRGTTARPRFRFAPELPPISLDPGQIGQAVQNISINAAQAMPDGGILEIEIESVEAPMSETTEEPPHRLVEISFRDHGVGIPREIIDRIFDPYFTTKPSGSGIGLATCFSIVRNHQGTLEVESEPGHGTTVRVRLPLDPGLGPDQPKAALRPIHGSGRILAMDDDAPTRKLMHRFLGRLGYDVLTTADGAEAVAAHRRERERGAPFDAIILDLTVPGGMGGQEALQAILEEEPEAIAIVASGYSETAVLGDFRTHGFKARLHKPFTMTDVSVVLDELLGPFPQPDEEVEIW